MQQNLHLRISTDLNEIAQVLTWLEACKPVEMSQRAWIEFQTAFIEGVTNAIRHAHRNQPPTTPIDIEIELSSDFIVGRVWDLGPAFDLDAKLLETSQEIDTESGHGRGLSILKSVADRLSYSVTEDNRNCLSILKYYTSK